MTMRIKICGVTNREDAVEACACGADYIGVIVNIEGSRRAVSIDIAAAVRRGVPRVVVLMEGPALDCLPALAAIHPYALQIVGECSPDDIRRLKQASPVQVWQTLPIPARPEQDALAADTMRRLECMQEAGTDAVVIDTLVCGKKGGTGQTCNWAIAKSVVQSATIPVFLAGGLTPRNVADAVAAVRPFGVDVSSGVETTPGRKDREKVAMFIRQARSA